NLVQALGRRIAADEEGAWLRAHCTNPLLEEKLIGLTVLTMHVLDAIGRRQSANGAMISKEMGIPKGTVSKITRRLLEHGLIETHMPADNRKEIHFNLTALGGELYHLHQRLHRRIDEGMERIFGKYDEEELRFIATFLEDLVTSPWIALDSE
ncbi:MAG: MarR family transcriptional regulator, partial [Firmicutes bacterium]|nr:MarR family transcriptional regulator [Bacillota bacterium]